MKNDRIEGLRLIDIDNNNINTVGKIIAHNTSLASLSVKLVGWMNSNYLDYIIETLIKNTTLREFSIEFSTRIPPCKILGLLGAIGKNKGIEKLNLVNINLSNYIDYIILMLEENENLTDICIHANINTKNAIYMNFTYYHANRLLNVLKKHNYKI